MSNDHTAVISMINRVLETIHIKINSGQFDFETDLKTLRRQTDVAQSINQPILAAWTLVSIAAAYTVAGQFEPAEHWFREALTLCETHHDHIHAGAILANLGELRRMAGKWDEAVVFYQQALTEADKAEESPEPTPTDMTLFGVRCAIHLNLGIIYLGLHRFEAAWAMVETARHMILEATRTDKSKGQLSTWVELNRILAEIALHQGDITKAWSLANLAEESAQSLGHYVYLADIALTKGHIASRDAAHPTPAATYYSTAREYIQQLGHDSYLARFLLAEATYQHQVGAKDFAKTYASEALALCTTLNMRDEALFAQSLIE